ncbi:hypothetical protein HVY60_11550 [Citrobacter freundii]|uniref:hypothetical protein n=1 Tax=Citrobacter freundii TaxID=546 RepID=UPI0015EEEAB4|nr:hypothetical protein [Citrobacter freundii]QMG41182.1 hypothetical protein HVY60_11550 [Citrobacter freundii]
MPLIHVGYHATSSKRFEALSKGLKPISVEEARALTLWSAPVLGYGFYVIRSAEITQATYTYGLAAAAGHEASHVDIWQVFCDADIDTLRHVGVKVDMQGDKFPTTYYETYDWVYPDDGGEITEIKFNPISYKHLTLVHFKRLTISETETLSDTI